MLSRFCLQRVDRFGDGVEGGLRFSVPALFVEDQGVGDSQRPRRFVLCSDDSSGERVVFAGCLACVVLRLSTARGFCRFLTWLISATFACSGP